MSKLSEAKLSADQRALLKRAASPEGLIFATQSAAVSSLVRKGLCSKVPAGRVNYDWRVGSFNVSKVTLTDAGWVVVRLLK